MALVRWDPGRDPDTFQTDINRVFDAFFGGRTANGVTRRWVPAMDLAETDDHLVLKADLPGLDADDVEIEVQDGVLTVSGERKTEHESSSNGYHRVERSYGGFSRSLSLPQGIDAGQVQAEFDPRRGSPGSAPAWAAAAGPWRGRARSAGASPGRAR
jgi:HSP20 family protein